MPPAGVKSARPAHRCTECGYASAKWVGRCPDCGGWGTVEEAPEIAAWITHFSQVPAYYDANGHYIRLTFMAPPQGLVGGPFGDLLNDLKERLGMSIMLITHAMGVVAEMAQRVVVMYAGKVVEEASATELFARPRHPYTQGLIRSIPRIDRAATHRVRLESIKGTVPKLIEPAEGCRFAPRCKYAIPACTAATPPLREILPAHKVACIRAEEIGV